MGLFDSLKKVRVRCENEEELNNLLQWLYKGKMPLSSLRTGTLDIEAILPRLEDMADGSGKIRGYFVSVPYEYAKPLLQATSVQDAFSDILTK